MNDIINRLKNSGTFFIGYLLFFIASLALLLSKGKAGSFLLLNSFHRHWLDTFFIFFTNLGDGLFAVLLSLLFFFVAKKKKLGLTLLVTYAATGIIAQTIKPLMESPRPQSYFAPQWQPFFIKGIIHIGYSSFPSGHTVTAFALATVLVLYQNNKWQYVLLLLLAALVGFSRIYLSQHFLTDVLAGSFIGVAGGILCAHFCRNINENKLIFKKHTSKR